MRGFFWVITGVGLLLMAAGLRLFNPPIIRNVVGSLLDQWYLDRVIGAFLLGLIVGVVWAGWVRWRLRYKPKQSGHEYSERVAGHGLLAQIASIGLVLLYVYVSARGASFIPLSPFDRFVGVVFAFKFLGVLGSALVSAGLSYAIITRTLSWGGRYALLRPDMVPSLSNEV